MGEKVIKEKLTVNVEKELLKQFKIYGIKNEITFGDLLDEAIREYLKNHSKEGK